MQMFMYIVFNVKILILIFLKILHVLIVCTLHPLVFFFFFKFFFLIIFFIFFFFFFFMFFNLNYNFFVLF